jgi:hypothetical protein
MSLLVLALALLLPVPAFAQYTRDAAANRKIDEAVNTHYLATDFDKAEGVLLGTVKACEDKCSPQTLARAWMYIGIVRGSGKSNLGGAKEAFQSATALDPSVKLDVALATAETQAAFNEASGGGGGTEPEQPVAPPSGGGDADEGEETPGGEGLDCTPTTAEIETRRRIPVQCTAEEDATSMELRYKPFGSDTWKTVRMQKKGDSFRGEVPCGATATAGTFRLYVRAKNAGGDDVGHWGSKSKPIEFALVEQSAAEPPSFDDAEPPARCAAKEECPPDFPGCESDKKGGKVDWGGSCDSEDECRAGLMCMAGTCESPPSCDLDADCPNGKCVGGKCEFEDSASMASGRFRRNWFGLHVAQDIALVSGTDVCSQEGQDSQNFTCYYAGRTDQPYVDDPYPGVNIGSGTAIGTTRILVSYDRAFTRNVLLGLRVGYALRGGPNSGRDVTYSGTEVDQVLDEGEKFLPFHAELRLTYVFRKNGVSSRGLRPYIHAGGGIAEVDAKVLVPIKDCGFISDPIVRADCVNGARTEAELDAYAAASGGSLDTDLDGWKKLGRQFVTIGGGVSYGLGDSLALQLNLNLMYLFPSSGLAIEPSLGLAYGL